MVKISNISDNNLNKSHRIYSDVIQPAAQESGKTLGLIPRAINAALVPIRKWVATKEYNLAETEKLLAYKLEHLDPEKIVSPEPYVAVPALQAISYSMNNEELRNLYANLLSNAMNISTKDNVHPSFVEIIKQLSPLDAKVFQIICTNTINPMINLNRKVNDDGGIVPLYKNITLIDIAPTNLISISINNLERLKLINIPFDSFYKNEQIYSPFYNLGIYKFYKKSIKVLNDHELTVEKKIIDVTDMGKSFYDICVKNN